MSLLDEAMVSCVMLDKHRISDGEGGYTLEWSESVLFNAAITFNSSLTAKVAEVQGVKSLYTVTLPRGITLDYHDVFRRLSDGKTFRVTSDGDDKHTPDRSSFQVSQVTAEEWKI